MTRPVIPIRALAAATPAQRWLGGSAYVPKSACPLRTVGGVFSAPGRTRAAEFAMLPMELMPGGDAVR
jgi:hypothetical protein